MKGSMKFALTVALASTGGHAFALGLGSIQVKSGLNQPLDAEIAIIADSPAEIAGLNVGLATAEDFQRVGLDRARLGVPIDFSVVTSGRIPIVKLTTKEPVREPFLDFLVEVNWSKGKLLREYTVLLDPPVMAPALKGSTATVAPAREAAPAPAEKLTSAPANPAKPPVVKPPRAVAEAKPEKPTAPPKPAPAAKPSAPERAAAAGEYGPVAEGETLSEIARATRDENVDINAMMLALLKTNPNAFYKDNINALKRGAILRIPSHDEIKAVGNAAAAAAAVREQNEAWAANAPVAKPTLVATAGAPKPEKPTPAQSPGEKPRTAGEHLALVPPAANKGGQNAADRPGPASGTGAANAELKAELARTREALASREQEVSELKSRVKDLEELNNKDQRLLALKQSEIAELQAKLKELETKGSAATKAEATKPTAAVAATTAPTKPSETKAEIKPEPKPETKLTAQDIWGKISETEKAPATKPAPSVEAAKTGPGAPTSPPTPTVPTAPTAPATTPVAAPTAPAAGPNPAQTPAPVAAAPPTAGKSGVAATTPLKPKPAPTVAPLPPPVETPWYQNTLLLGGLGVGLLLIGVLALLRFMRKPKAVPALGEPEREPAEATSAEVEDEQALLDRLAEHPGDPELSLRLLNLYYAQRDAAKFEATAEAMYAHIADPTQPEWQQVRAMGEELCPHNPLFGGHEDVAAMAAYEPAVPEPETPAAAESARAVDLGGFGHEAESTEEERFDFDLTDHVAAAPAPAVVASAPPASPPAAEPAPAPTPVSTAAAAKADDFFAGEDAIGTKLDLARAYLDMGDPEGARSMLDEVLAEGNDAQKGEARKLLAEIR